MTKEEFFSRRNQLLSESMEWIVKTAQDKFDQNPKTQSVNFPYFRTLDPESPKCFRVTRNNIGFLKKK